MSHELQPSDNFQSIVESGRKNQKYVVVTTGGRFEIEASTVAQLEKVIVVDPPRFINLRHSYGRSLVAVSSIMTVSPIASDSRITALLEQEQQRAT